MITQIYRLFKYFIENRISEIKNFDLLTNSTFDEKSNKRYAYPAIFMDIQPINIKTYLNRMDVATVFVDLHLVQKDVTRVTNTDKFIDNTLESLKLIDKLYKELDLINSIEMPIDLIDDNFIIYRIKRVGIEINQKLESNVLRDTIVRFKFDMLDATNIPQKDYIYLSSIDDFSIDTRYIDKIDIS